MNERDSFQKAAELTDRCLSYLSQLQSPWIRNSRTGRAIVYDLREVLEIALPLIRTHEESLNLVSDGVIGIEYLGEKLYFPSAHNAVVTICFHIRKRLNLKSPAEFAKGVKLQRTDLSALDAHIRRERALVIERLGSEPAQPTEGSYPGKLANDLKVTTKTVNRHARKLGIGTPKQGEREFRYSPEDAERIRWSVQLNGHQTDK